MVSPARRAWRYATRASFSLARAVLFGMAHVYFLLVPRGMAARARARWNGPTSTVGDWRAGLRKRPEQRAGLRKRPEEGAGLRQRPESGAGLRKRPESGAGLRQRPEFEITPGHAATPLPNLPPARQSPTVELLVLYRIGAILGNGFRGRSEERNRFALASR